MSFFCNLPIHLPEEPENSVPKLRHHKATRQAYVVLNGHAIYFGRYGTQEATENYHKTIAEWLSCGKQVAVEGADIDHHP